MVRTITVEQSSRSLTLGLFFSLPTKMFASQNNHLLVFRDGGRHCKENKNSRMTCLGIHAHTHA